MTNTLYCVSLNFTVRIRDYVKNGGIKEIMALDQRIQLVKIWVNADQPFFILETNSKKNERNYNYITVVNIHTSHWIIINIVKSSKKF